MSDGPIWVVGAGGHAKVVLATLRAMHERAACLFDDDPCRQGAQIVGKIVDGPMPASETFAAAGACAFVAVGDNARRSAIVAGLAGVPLATIIHPRAIVCSTARIGEGALICAGAIVQADAFVGRGAIVNTGAIVEHDCRLGEFSHVASGAVLAGGVVVGDRALVGAGASVRPGVHIGDDAICGTGSAVVREVRRGTVVIGTPARPRER